MRTLNVSGETKILILKILGGETHGYPQGTDPYEKHPECIIPTPLKEPEDTIIHWINEDSRFYLVPQLVNMPRG